MVMHEDRILTILGTGPADVAVGATAIVVAGDAPAVLVADIQDRVDRRPQAAAVQLDFEDLSLLGRELEVVMVPRLFQDTIEGRGSFHRGQSSRGIVVFDFIHIRQR